MLKAIAQNYSGLYGFQQLLTVAAHNIANVNTTAYKEKQVSFQDLTCRALAERRLPHAGNPPLPPQSGRGTAISSVVPSGEQGALAYTGRNLDLAVVGEGFFRVIRPDGSYAYTRAGNFNPDGEGNLTMPGGLLLDLPFSRSDYADRLDFDAVTISRDGTVQAALLPGTGREGDNSGLAVQELGRIPLYHFINPQSLSSIGDNLLQPSMASGPPREGFPGQAGCGEIRCGYLERANVDMVRQITTLIRGQRALQSNARALNLADELWGLTLNLQA